MKTLHFEIPTMTRLYKQVELSKSLKKLGIYNIKTESGKAEITCENELPKVDIIIAIEEAGYVVIY
jgi:hypothetical protein